MKRTLLFLSLVLLLCSCPYEPYEGVKYSAYKPLLMTRTSLENSIVWQASKEMVVPGKIYYFNNYIYINEKYKGIHVIDNSDIKNPKKIGFIVVPGCIDMARKGSVLYADNAVDLVAIDISVPESPRLTKRVKNIFPEMKTPDNLTVDPAFHFSDRPKNSVIVGWQKVDNTPL